ncbi:MAG TPA: serine hydrolase domain-containing protein, partial [Vicinamibacteria bacterium]|nr:serine hydrolase domain-containing protein [Vicinamibacteria bacterium]
MNRCAFRSRRVAAAFAALAGAGIAALATAGTPAPADADQAPGAPVGAMAPQRFAPSLPPPAFADPGRRARLAAAVPEIDRVFREFAEHAKVPGLAYGLVIDGELAHAGAVGLRDVAAGAPPDADSVFRIASMTKSFTALAILKLRDEGRLSLDDPVARYLPELASLAYPTRDSPVLTVRHLLTHSEGFPEDNPWGDRQLAIPDARLGEWLRRGIPFSNAPGVAFEYSNYGFALLGRIVARASGLRYRDYVDARILRPLGMTATAWEASAVAPGHLAKGYRREGDDWVEEPPLGDGAFGAMGGLFSSVRDLARYVSFFLAAWPPRDDPDPGPVRRASLREMQQAWRAYSATATRETVEGPLRLGAGGYGYGLGVSQTCRARPIVSHSGGLPGFGSQMRWLPDHGVGIVALANRTYAGPGVAIARAIEALADTGALEARVVPPSPALRAARDAVDRLIESWDDRLADGLAADNLFLDRPRERRARELQDLRAAHGRCRPDGDLTAENRLRGRWT